ncbi:hypothetical protein WN51_13157 [Melipona quadrifasciata]|uniref:Uncharacterized protein n=1 Tax=Melipona quadrifasciata TaxID=166423 RepID=A0A0N0BGL4_9HYME|nr:hypothetical protein WN51_13157 [Melipona quadrifasciata]
MKNCQKCEHFAPMQTLDQALTTLIAVRHNNDIHIKRHKSLACAVLILISIMSRMRQTEANTGQRGIDCTGGNLSGANAVAIASATVVYAPFKYTKCMLELHIRKTYSQQNFLFNNILTPCHVRMAEFYTSYSAFGSIAISLFYAVWIPAKSLFVFLQTLGYDFPGFYSTTTRRNRAWKKYESKNFSVKGTDAKVKCGKKCA